MTTPQTVSLFFLYYFVIGSGIFLLYITYYLLVKNESLPHALELEAIRCGITAEAATKNAAWKNGVLTIILWPSGMIQSLRELGN